MKIISPKVLYERVYFQEGKRSSYELGTVLRARYGEWFGHQYSKKKVDFLSADNERAKMTASLVAAGLFPPDLSEKYVIERISFQCRIDNLT